MTIPSTPPRSPIIDTHTFDPDPTHALSAVARWTCRVCDRAVLANGPVIYGSASETPCVGTGTEQQ